MPLPILLGLVVLGIAGIALMLHLTGHSRPFALGSDAVARVAWARLCPDDPVHALHLAGGVALVQAASGLSLLRPLGADAAAHRIAAMDPAPGGLRIGFDDLGFADLTVALPPETAAHWLHLWETRDA